MNTYLRLDKPLRELLKKEKEFELRINEQKSFNLLKEALMSRLALKFVDRSHEEEVRQSYFNVPLVIINCSFSNRLCSISADDAEKEVLTKIRNGHLED